MPTSKVSARQDMIRSLELFAKSSRVTLEAALSRSKFKMRVVSALPTTPPTPQKSRALAAC
jgi:hypothetical protein